MSDDERSAFGSDNDNDETMRDAPDEDEDVDNEDAEGDDEADNDDDDDLQSERDHQNEDGIEETQVPGPEGADQHKDSEDEVKKVPDLTHPRPEVLNAETYDIVPTIAAPMSTSINAITSTSDARWLFTGGADGYIRQYNWVESVNGKTLLTVAQRHPFVDSVVKAGVLTTYWENYDARRGDAHSNTWLSTQTLSPVYALACHSAALWLVAGTASGAIRLQTVRHDEGREVALLQKHTSAVSVLALSSDETSLLSGSWDKSVVDWDLNTGQVRTTFASSGGQISCIESRPVSSLPVPFETGEVIKPNGASTDEVASTSRHGAADVRENGDDNQVAKSPDSLFGADDGDEDDLFGDNTAVGAPNGHDFGFDDAEMTGTMEELPTAETAPESDAATKNVVSTMEHSEPATKPATADADVPVSDGVPTTAEPPVSNGVSHTVDSSAPVSTSVGSFGNDDKQITSDSTFLATSIDGSIRVWDRRQPDPVARIVPHDTPPWCLSACWSPDGNNIYAGRRNNTVEEYDLRKGLKRPERIFRFPQGSGAVTSVRAMPNSRHLVCASYDILRLYDLKPSMTGQSTKSTVPFLIVPGHRTGTISHLHLSKDCRYMMSTGGNRGWEGQPTEVLLGYEIGVPKTR